MMPSGCLTVTTPAGGTSNERRSGVARKCWPTEPPPRACSCLFRHVAEPNGSLARPKNARQPPDYHSSPYAATWANRAWRRWLVAGRYQTVGSGGHWDRPVGRCCAVVFAEEGSGIASHPPMQPKSATARCRSVRSCHGRAGDPIGLRNEGRRFRRRLSLGRRELRLSLRTLCQGRLLLSRADCAG